MECKMSEAATTKLKEILENEDDKQLKFRVFVGHAHGDHAHYGLGLDYQKETDELVTTNTGVEVLLEKNEKFLRNIEVDYNPDKDEWSIVNPNSSHHHHE
ncbi:iron-sulfur cluster assembly accessory protein [Alicyclobacillus sp. SO9]|uniref:iron-sulfur cluster assembly accessory protein n=1 Tax=Alicyclobacillus sp. SO9 TaxID=2665646 RepID=UPI0018E7A326|nr:iron-sulfur cluster assembly accessory protein [Alicyclobacillus sp. SO9]QQE81033.1 iron-sulfur cluster assembly accessory protein [Alicyclobacillus sp. SO9]